MNVWRIHLKTESRNHTYRELLDYCKENEIIGIGWDLEGHRINDESEIDAVIDSIEKYKDDKGVKKATHAMMRMREGDLIWTRLAESSTEYYLCRVGSRLWKDILPSEIDKSYDLCQYVSAQWVYVGDIEAIPGKVVNSFSAVPAVQRVNDIEDISKAVWNLLSSPQDRKYNMQNTDGNIFWRVIPSEELECLVFLYIQSKGYYLYSSTVKHTTAEIEGKLVNCLSGKRAAVQVKRGSTLKVEDFAGLIKENCLDELFLFTTSENYGTAVRDDIFCLTKSELERFITQHKAILPLSIRNWLDYSNTFPIRESVN